MSNFLEALDVKVDEIEKPPLPPIGHYVFQVSKPVRFGEVGQGVWDTVDFQLTAKEAKEDVDPKELKAMKAIGNVSLRHRFMFRKVCENEEEEKQADRAKYNLRLFLSNHLGIDTSGMSVRQALDAAQGQICLANVQHRPNPDDPENPYAEIGRTAPAS